MTFRIPRELLAAWDATEAAPDDDEPAAQTRATTKGTATGRGTGDRWRVLNDFTDLTMRELTRAETAVWLVLYRDTKAADGTARTSQADLARRAGVNIRTAKRAVLSLCRRGLLTVVYRGGLRRGPSTYRVWGTTKTPK